MSNPNFPTQSQNDARYATPANLSSAIATQAATDAGQYAKIGFNILKYGADPTGATDSTSAIQAAIAASLATTSPVSTTRLSGGYVYLPGSGVQGVPAKYKISATLLARSTQGFGLIGAGAEQVQLVVTGLSGSPVIWLDGSYRGIVGGFTVTGDGTEAVSDVIRTDWSVNANRSSTANKLYDIQIRNIKFVNGVTIASDASTQGQNDGTILERVVVAGSTATTPQSDTTYWQNGFLLNPAGPTHSNNYNHWFYGSYSSFCVNGVNCQYSAFSIRDAEPYGNGTDFYINGTAGGNILISGVNSQSAGRLLTFNRSSSAWIAIAIRDTVWQSSYPASDGQVVQALGMSGTLALENTICRDNTGNTTLTICCTPTVALHLRLAGFAMTTAYASALNINTKTSIVVLDYKQVSTSVSVLSSYTSLAVPENGYASYATSGTFTVPAGVTTLRIRARGGGGGGGGGGSAALTSGVTAQVGGGGGGQGTVIDSQYSVTAGQSISITIGAGGTHGTGAVASTGSTGNTGTSGSTGSNTTISGTGVSIVAYGSGGGATGAANSTTQVYGGVMGAGNNATVNYIPGSGGGSGRQAIAFVCAAGGGGGGAASGTLGGGGGVGGITSGGSNPGATAASSTTAGVNGTTAILAGSGGGGGGGGAPGGAGGDGGDGAPGFAEFWWS